MTLRANLVVVVVIFLHSCNELLVLYGENILTNYLYLSGEKKTKTALKVSGRQSGGCCWTSCELSTTEETTKRSDVNPRRREGCWLTDDTCRRKDRLLFHFYHKITNNRYFYLFIYFTFFQF